MTALTPEQRELIVACARNTAGARVVLDMLSQLEGLDATAVLVTALTCLIEGSYAPQHRVTMLNALLAPTVAEWTVATASAGSAVQ